MQRWEQSPKVSCSAGGGVRAEEIEISGARGYDGAREQGASANYKEDIVAKQSKKLSRLAGNTEMQTVKKNSEPSRRNGDGEPSGGVENLDKVRDILFGSQMRDNERRFGQLEERLSREASDVRDETRKRLESLEVYVRKELQSVLERLKGEQGQRGEAIKEIAQELKELTKATQQRGNELQEQTAETQRLLRQEALDQSKSMRDELQQSRADASAELDRTAGELRTQKLDRAALADLLAEMAARLGEQD